MILLAFPGMGKTPLSRKNAKYADLDFGYFREALNVKKQNEATILKNFSKFMKFYENDGFIVLSNEPKLMDVSRVTKVFLPSNPKFSAKKMGVSEDTISQWVNDWAELAKKHNVPVTYLNVGLDHYLK